MLEKILEKLGLSEKEAKVYLAALELGQDSVQNIAKKADVNRPTTYVILEKLMKMGLVSSHEQGKKTFFIATGPQELETILDKQIAEIENQKKELKVAMNQLTAIYNARSDKPVVRYFEGADGLMAMERCGGAQLKKNEEILGLTPIDVLEKYFPERRKDSLNERIKAGVKSRVIYTKEGGSIPMSQDKKELRTGIHISGEKYPLKTAITIYPGWGIKIFFFDAAKPYGILIEGAEIASNFKIFFDLAWLGAKNDRAAD